MRRAESLEPEVWGPPADRETQQELVGRDSRSAVWCGSQCCSFKGISRAAVCKPCAHSAAAPFDPFPRPTEILDAVFVCLCLTASPTNLHWAAACLFHLLVYPQSPTTGPAHHKCSRDASLNERAKLSATYQAFGPAKLHEGSEESGVPKPVGGEGPNEGEEVSRLACC